MVARQNGISMTSNLRGVVQVVMVPFHNFSITLNVKINCAINYENLFNFVEVLPKIHKKYGNKTDHANHGYHGTTMVQRRW